MPRIEPLPIEGNLYMRVLAHRPEILEKFVALDTTIRFTGKLSPELKEEVRRSTAERMGCRFCASLGRPAPDHEDRRVSLAVAVAQMIAEDHRSVDDRMFAVLREDFTDEEIVELLSWICLVVLGGQMLGNLLGLEPGTPEDIALYTQWREEGMAAAQATD